MSEKTILILTSNFPPTNIVGALRPFRLSRFLSKRGWRVVVVTHPPKTGQDLDDSLMEEVAGSVEVHYLPAARKEGKSVSPAVRRLNGACRDLLARWVKPDLDIVHVARFYRTASRIMANSKIDLLLTTSPPHSIHIAGLMLKRASDIRWVADFRDPWDDYTRKGNYGLSNGLERYLERVVVARSDAVIATTETNLQVLRDKHPDQDPGKFHVVTNSYNQRKTFQRVAKDPEHFVVCYTGIFYPEKDPYGFFRALRSWFESMPHPERERVRSLLRIHLIGSGDHVTRQTVKTLGLDDVVVFFNRMPHDDAIRMTLAADLVLISTGQAERTRPGWLPSKLFEYLGCRIPILSLIREGDMAEIIRKTNSGYVFTCEDSDGIRKALEAEIGYKFGSSSALPQAERFTFQGIERFEEHNVMSDFASVLDDTCWENR